MVNVRKDWTLLLEVKLTTSPHARNDVFSCVVKCSGAKVQVTGHRSGHRSHTKTIGHWTKLFLIDILLHKNRTSQGTSIILFLF